MQVCQQGADYVELFIYLGEPCHVCQLLLTVSHGAEDSSYPATVDVRVGSSIDSLKLVVEVLVSILPHWFYYNILFFCSSCFIKFLCKYQFSFHTFKIWLGELTTLYPKSRLQRCRHKNCRPC
jgi:hypothetical protein